MRFPLSVHTRLVQVAINLATWISPRFEVLVTEIADRYLTGQITTEESQAAAATVAQLFNPDHVRLADWHKQRQDSREATKVCNLAVQQATGNRASGVNYACLHDSANWAAAGYKTKELRRQLGIKGTPRDHMAAPQLSMVAYVEGLGAVKVGEKRALAQADLEPRATVEEVGRLAYEAHHFTKGTGGHALALLAHKPPTMKQVQKALEAPKPTKRQQLVLQKAEMRPAAAMPAPKTGQDIRRFFKAAAVPRAVPASQLDLYESH